jgi:predicted CXXCH cytochrome family protein
VKVVGHFDQLVLSRCYQESGTLTCLSCHNPHYQPSAEGRVAFYRSICLTCHREEDCGVDAAARAVRSSENDCTKCHMPGVPTEIVHLAFTHHRIGVHAEGEQPAARESSERLEIEPWHDLSRLSEIDRQRSEGLAWFARGLDYGPHTEFCLARAQDLLEDVRDQGLEEGVVAAALAAIASRTPGPQAPQLAALALGDLGLPATARIGVLYLLAADHYRNQRPDRAIELLQELTRLRRHSADWALLGFCELARRDSQAAIAAFEKSVAINPQQLSVHKELARLHEAAGAGEQATHSRRMAKRLQDIAGAPAHGARRPVQASPPQ